MAVVVGGQQQPSAVCAAGAAGLPFAAWAAVTCSAGLGGDSCGLGVLDVFQLGNSFWELGAASVDSGKGFLLWCVNPKFNAFSCNTG